MPKRSKNQPMTPQQIAGHLGVANNPNLSDSVRHRSRQKVIAQATSNGNRSEASIAGQIGATSNPQFSSYTQHVARQAIMRDAC